MSDAAAPAGALKGETGTTDASWFGHPKQLARLFTTEMWERFGYYGMRALLGLFLLDHFLFRDNVANGIYGAFTSLVYLTPLFGGLLADRYLGSKRSVKLGALLMAVGYLGLCFHGQAAKPFIEIQGQRYDVVVEKAGETRTQYVVAGEQRFQIKGNDDGSLTLKGSDGSVVPQTVPAGAFRADGQRDPFWVTIVLLSLSTIIIGNGFFKPNISTIVGSLYPKGDSRRDAGFTIFYMGINIGSILSQFIAPLLAIAFGWWAGFGLAAAGMLVAFAMFQFDGGRLAGYGEQPAGAEPKSATMIVLGSIAAIPIAYFFLSNTMVNAEAASQAAAAGSGFLGYLASLPLLGKILFTVSILAFVGIPIWAWRVGTRAEFQMMVVAIILCIFSVVFFTLFEQAGSSLTFFADRNTDREVGFYTMPAGQVQIFNPIFIVLLAPLFSVMWVALAKRGLEPSIPVKFAIGLAFVGLGFLALVFGTRFAGVDFRVPLMWVALAYLLHSIGELCLSPVGLSMITKLSIPRVVGLMMGVWFLASAMAQYVGGIVAQFASVETIGGEVTNLKVSLDTYVGVFETIGWVAMGFALLCLVMSPWLTRWMHGVR